MEVRLVDKDESRDGDHQRAKGIFTWVKHSVKWASQFEQAWHVPLSI